MEKLLKKFTNYMENFRRSNDLFEKFGHKDKVIIQYIG